MPVLPAAIIQCDKFNVGEKSVTGWAKYHTATSRDARSLGQNNGNPTSQTTVEVMQYAMDAINGGRAEFVQKGGASGLDDIVLVDGAFFGVHPPSHGGRQIYPMHRAEVIPSRNSYGGFNGSFTYNPDPGYSAENTRSVSRDLSATLVQQGFQEWAEMDI
jgi:hypothetical protein